MTAAVHPLSPTMADIVQALSEVYTADGVALALASRPLHLSRVDMVIELCMTVEGRRRVYAWAYSLGEMVAT